MKRRSGDGRRRDRMRSMLEEGTRAPAFTLPDHRGAEVALDDLAGRWVVFWWFVKADTPG